jgi:hypothetical protein
MARKRNTESEPRVSAAAAPLREKRKTSRTTHVAKPSADPVAESVVAPVVQAVPVVAETSAPAFTTDDIARLAYSYWEARGYQGGSPEEDWLRAEAELRSQSLATKL